MEIPPHTAQTIPLSDFQRGYFSSENTKVYLKFQVDITANYLWGVHRFSSYRKHLKDLILNLLDKKLTYEQIANKLNEMNYKTLRGNSFNKGNVFKIVWNIRANRRVETKPIYSNFKLYFIKSKI